MKKLVALALMLVISGSFSYAEMSQEEYLGARKVDKSKQIRYLITTDLEIDDTNGILMAMLYSNEYDLAGIVWTAGMFHFSGDGQHTLGEITPNSRCPRVEAASFKSYRPVDPDLVPRLIRENYTADYEYLSQNDPNYPTPEQMMSIYKVGNIAFEGDVRYDTEGSELIRKAMLDDDPRPLFITAWGGINTTVRAMLKIYEEYKGTSQWEAIRRKITEKVYFMGRGEDNCWSDQKIDEIYPGLHTYGSRGSGGYGNYFSAITGSPDILPFLQAEWLAGAIKLNHGRLTEEFHLMGDGQRLVGEEDWFQPGLSTVIDWAKSPESNEKRDLSMYPRREFDVFDWCCLQYNGLSFVNFGLRGSLKNPNYGTITGRITIDGERQDRAGNSREYNPVTGSLGSYSTRFSTILFEEFAARADWSIHDYEDCNHAPIVTAEAPDVTAKAGEIVELAGAVKDPDGDDYKTNWWVWNAASDYAGAAAGMLDVWGAKTLTAKFTVPRDAEVGDYFNVLMQVQDKAERPMTRFAQFIITVIE